MKLINDSTWDYDLHLRLGYSVALQLHKVVRCRVSGVPDVTAYVFFHFVTFHGYTPYFHCKSSKKKSMDDYTSHPTVCDVSGYVWRSNQLPSEYSAKDHSFERCEIFCFHFIYNNIPKKNHKE